MPPGSSRRCGRKHAAYTRSWPSSTPNASKPETADLIRQLAQQNPTWGKRRLAGELRKLGISVSANTVAATLRRLGLQPAPDRTRPHDEPWAVAFEPATTAAMDWTTIAVGDGAEARNLHALFIIHLGSRRAELLGVTAHPDAAYVQQIARNLTMADTGFLDRHGIQTLIMDRDTIFTAAFRHLLGETVSVERIPPRCPQCNAYIERFIGNLRRTILRTIHFANEAALVAVLNEFIHDHYNHERPHQGRGIDNRVLTSTGVDSDTGNPIRRFTRLGGVVNHYERAA